MFVSIDMDALRFLHKHHDHETVSAISWLECGQLTSIRIEPYHDRSMFLRNVSDLDVRMLYRNTTGKDLPKDSDATAARYQLADVVQLMHTTTALTHEVLAQVAAVDDRLHQGERFKYALGSKVPAQPGELFPLTARPLTEQELATAHSHSRNPVRGYPARTADQPLRPWEIDELRANRAAGTAAPQDAPEADTPVKPKAGKARAGSVQPVVFAAAKLAWENRTPQQSWGTIKEDLAAKLIADGYHPTTVRIKLSKWAKENGI
jgi:hypothetical protein